MQERELRQEAIRRLVRTGTVGTQAALVERLSSLGHPCTQGTVSRDVAQMGLQKLPGGVYALGDDLSLKSLLESRVIYVTHAANLAVIRCDVNAALDVAVAFDHCDFDEVVGTVSGVDTVLVVCESEEAAASMETLLDRLPWPDAE